MGSILVGDSKFIKKCNHFRKQQGGGIRQSGMMARMALCSVNGDWKTKLRHSHELAHELAAFCDKHQIPLESPADTNFVFLDLQKAKMNPDVLVKKGLKYGVKLMGGRVSFHYQITRETLENVKLAVLEAFEYAKEHPFDTNGPTKIYRSESTDFDINGNPIGDIKTYKY